MIGNRKVIEIVSNNGNKKYIYWFLDCFNIRVRYYIFNAKIKQSIFFIPNLNCCVISLFELQEVPNFSFYKISNQFIKYTTISEDTLYY